MAIRQKRHIMYTYMRHYIYIYFPCQNSTNILQKFKNLRHDFAVSSLIPLVCDSSGDYGLFAHQTPSEINSFLFGGLRNFPILIAVFRWLQHFRHFLFLSIYLYSWRIIYDIIYRKTIIYICIPYNIYLIGMRPNTRNVND